MLRALMPKRLHSSHLKNSGDGLRASAFPIYECRQVAAGEFPSSPRSRCSYFPRPREVLGQHQERCARKQFRHRSFQFQLISFSLTSIPFVAATYYSTEFAMSNALDVTNSTATCLVLVAIRQFGFVELSGNSDAAPMGSLVTRVAFLFGRDLDVE